MRMSNTVNLTAAQAAMIGQDVKATATPTFAGISTNGTGDVSLLHAAQTAGSGTAGAASRLVGGAGAAASGGTAAALGGALAVTGGVGGASDGVDLAANGGAASITGGAGGAAHTAVVGGIGATATVAGGAGGAGSAGALGGAGGNALLNAGAGGVTGGGGAGANGNVLIGSANTAAIQLGNVTDNTGIQVLGTGNINLLGGGAILHPDLVRVTIVATGGIGGATAGTISVQVSDLAGTAINRAVKLRLDSSLVQFGGGLASTGTAFFGAATTGAINHGTGTLYAIVTTDATGLYEGALDDAADETAWFSATTAPGGFANAAEGCVVVECVPNDATWSA